MMILIIGFICPPTVHFKFITKCDKCYYKVRQFYYKVRQNIPYAVCLNRASSLEPRSLVLSWLIQLSFYKGNLQAKLLFSDSRTIATLVNYTCESFINVTVDSSVRVTSSLRKFLGS